MRFTTLLRNTVRTLVKAPSFTIVVLTALALGIGANTAIYSIFDGVILHPLPVRDPDRLFEVELAWSYLDYLDFRDRADVFSGLAAFAGRDEMRLGSGERSDVIAGALVTTNYFQTLGVSPVIGRSFGEADTDQPVVVVGHDLWQRRFAGDPGVLGRTLTINGQSVSVIGVAPRRFRGTSLSSDFQVWIPLELAPQVLAGPMADLLLRARDFTWLRLIGRIQPGVSPQQAERALNRVNRQLGEQFPDIYRESSVRLRSVTSTALGFQREETLNQFVWGLAVMVGLVLLVACANVAGLLLARAMRHRKDLAMRLALGARRRDLIRQLLAESVGLAVLGGIAGLAVALLILRLLSPFELPGGILIDTLELGINRRVLGFTICLSVLVGGLFGLIPALQASRPNLVESLKDQVPAQGHSRARLRTAFVATQLAFSLVLLIGTGLFVRSFQQALHTDIGFDPHRVALVAVDLGLLDYDAARAEGFYRQSLERVRSLPGVEAASWANLVPFRRARVEELRIEGYVPSEGEDTSILVNYVTPEYFGTMGLELVRGRDFSRQDDSDSVRVALVNQVTSERYWPEGEARGRRISLDGGESWVEITGVVEDSKYRDLGESPRTYLYLPLFQHMDAAGVDEMNLLVRAENPDRLIPVVRNVLIELDRNTPVLQTKTLHQHMADVLMPQRMGFTVLGGFSFVALMLATVGTYGLLSYLVSMRSHEIGVRMALGAARREIVALILLRSLAPLGIGIALGLLIAFWATRLMATVLVGVSRSDPATLALTTAALTVVVLLASCAPALRASRLNPTRALSEP